MRVHPAAVAAKAVIAYLCSRSAHILALVMRALPGESLTAVSPRCDIFFPLSLVRAPTCQWRGLKRGFTEKCKLTAPPSCVAGTIMIKDVVSIAREFPSAESFEDPGRSRASPLAGRGFRSAFVSGPTSSLLYLVHVTNTARLMF